MIILYWHKWWHGYAERYQLSLTAWVLWWDISFAFSWSKIDKKERKKGRKWKENEKVYSFFVNFGTGKKKERDLEREKVYDKMK